MSERILAGLLRALGWAVLERNTQGQLRLVVPAPEWLAQLWPGVVEAGSVLPVETSPFLENFLVDAADVWQMNGAQRARSGPWLESDAAGRNHSLQATALTVEGRALLLIEELGSAYEERSSIVQKAHEAALAYEQLQRVRQALAEEKRLLEARVQERTAELSRANTALREEIVRRRHYAEQLETMHEIDKAILAAQSPQSIAEAALRRIYPLLPCDHACVVELDAESGRGTILASVARGQLTTGGPQALRREQLEDAQVLKSLRLQRLTNAPNLFDVAPPPPEGGPRLWPLIVDLPLVAEETVIGVLNLAIDSPAAFTSAHEEVAQTVAGQLAVALRQARLFAQLSASRKRLRALSQRVVEAQETERRFMARELHDEIGQLLTSLKLTLKIAGRPGAEPAEGHLNEAIALVDELLHRARQLSLDLRPPVLDDFGLLPALNWLFKRYFKQTGIRVQFKHTPIPGRLPTQLETAVFRIVQEALTNVARHAGVKEATARLWIDGDRLGVQVEDKGAGFDPAHAQAGHESSGLAGMRERALVLGGEFTLDSAPGAGTRLTVELPLDAELEPPARLETNS